MADATMLKETNGRKTMHWLLTGNRTSTGEGFSGSSFEVGWHEGRPYFLGVVGAHDKVKAVVMWLSEGEADSLTSMKVPPGKALVVLDSFLDPLRRDLRLYG